MNKYLITGLLLLAAGILAGCRSGKPAETAPAETKPVETAAPETSASVETLPDAVSQEGQLVAAAQSQEEAQSIAELYGIRLVDWGYGVAKFYTDEDPREVIRRGQENGWPELDLNHIQKAF